MIISKFSRTALRRPHGLARSNISLAVMLASGVLASQSSYAMRFGSEESGLSGSFDSTLTYGMSSRMQSQDCHILGNDSGGCNVGANTELSRYYNLASGTGYANADVNFTNGDDGDLNYDKHDVYSNVLKGMHELSLKFGDGWSALGRFSWMKDSKIDNVRNTELDHNAKSEATESITLLDLWVAKRFDVGDMPAKVKVGNQVISWGEEIFTSGGINQINSINLPKFHAPGTQLKEVFIPAPMASLNIGLNDSLSLETYYQFKWNDYNLDPSGTYFSYADIVGAGGHGPIYLPTSVVDGVNGAGTCAFLTPTGHCGAPNVSGLDNQALIAMGLAIPYSGKYTPSDGGQYGAALRWQVDEIETEFGFYYQRYHDKTPFVGYTGNSSLQLTSYFIDYGTDKDLYGISMNKMLGSVAVGAELSFRPEESVAVDPTVSFGSVLGGAFNKNSVFDVGWHPGYVEEKKWQLDVNATYSFSGSDSLGFIPQSLGATDALIIVEGVAVRYPDLKTDGSVPYQMADYSLPDKQAFSYVTEFALNYQDSFGTGITVTPQLDFSHDVSGTAPNTTFVEGRKSLSTGLYFNYRDQWKGGLQWVQYWGGGDLNALTDRDFISGNISYSF